MFYNTKICIKKFSNTYKLATLQVINIFTLLTIWQKIVIGKQNITINIGNSKESVGSKLAYNSKWVIRVINNIMLK